MRTHYERLRDLLGEVYKLRQELFPSPQCDLWVQLLRVEYALYEALLATPERQEQLHGGIEDEVVDLAPEDKAVFKERADRKG